MNGLSRNWKATSEVGFREESCPSEGQEFGNARPPAFQLNSELCSCALPIISGFSDSVGLAMNVLHAGDVFSGAVSPSPESLNIPLAVFLDLGKTSAFPWLRENGDPASLVGGGWHGRFVVLGYQKSLSASLR